MNYFTDFDVCLIYPKTSVCYSLAKPVSVRCKAADVCTNTCPKWFTAKTTSDIFRSDERYWDKDYHDPKNVDAVTSFHCVIKKEG